MPEAPRFSPFHNWKQSLLSKRGLHAPDGRSLYRYRLTEEEFRELEALQRHWLSQLFTRFDLDDVAARLTGFSALFVLYAAEWWRRHYDGSHWAWEPILRALGANPDEWNQAQRSECVRQGLQDWGLQPRESGGLRYLGTVAVQGGLPLKLLAEAKGGVGHVLSRVLQLSGNKRVTPSDLQTWVESLETKLPKSYRQTAIFALLADVAWTVLRLKEEAGLTSSEDAISRLDAQIPDWRECFPLPIGDSHAQGMIEQLVRDVASVRIERQTICLPLERRIERDSDGAWNLVSILTLPDSIEAKQLAKLFDVQTDELPRAAELVLIVDGQHYETAIRRMAGHEKYRIEQRPWGFAGEAAVQEHVLLLSAPDGRRWSVTAPKGSLLDEELPWVFVPEGDAFRFVRQGSGGVAATEALLALPAGWFVKPVEGADATEEVHLESPKRRLFRIHGTVHTQNSAGSTCRIRTGQAGAGEESYEWRGARLWLDFQNPGMAFLGLPDLYQVSQDGTSHKVDGKPGWSVIGSNTPSNGAPLGPISVRYPATGEVKQRARMVVLPSSAKWSLKFHDTTSGEIRLENWGAVHAKSVDPELKLETRVDGNTLVLTLATDSNHRPPEWVEVDVYWRHTTIPVQVRLPFPAKGARLFTANGQELRSGALLAAYQLAGVRLLVLGGAPTAMLNITLELQMKGGQRRIDHRLSPPVGSARIEVRLQDFFSDIQHLLSTDDSPDSQVQAVLRIGGNEHFKLHLARYAAKLEKNGSQISLDARGINALTPESIEALPVLALRLERPGDEAFPLPACSSEGVPTGSWNFSPELREPGSWLVFPGPDSTLQFRPTLWPVAGEVHTESPLAQAIGLADIAERESALDEVITAMSADFLEPCWIELERLAGQVGHLPLTTLDLWRRFARSQQGMAALAIRFGILPGGFLERFELELPFAWETVSFAAWKHAISSLERQCTNSYGAETGSLIFRSHLETRITDLTSRHGALHFLLGLASASRLPAAMSQVKALRGLGAIAEYHLFDGEDSLLMQLRRRQINDGWPNGINSFLTQARSTLEQERVLCPSKHGYCDGVINLPLLLAAQVATNKTEEWLTDPADIHALRTHRAFDPDWFDEAYNLTIARCLATGLLEI